MQTRTNLAFIILSLLAIEGCKPGGSKSSSGSGSSGSTTSTDDPLASYAWHLNNTGQTTFSTGTATSGQDISVKSVHDSGIKGAGIKIAVSDTGVDVTHPDLSANQISGQHRDYSTD